MRYKLNADVEAVRWYPDSSLLAGMDDYGIEYSYPHHLLVVAGRGILRLLPGDWLVTIGRERFVMGNEQFLDNFGES